MSNFSLLIKPASADCNLNCEYCFYLPKSALYPGASVHRMSDDTLEKLISSYMKTRQDCYSFGWQGGEPTLMGAEFFSKVVEYQKKHGRSGVAVSNGLQTNGTLINDEMAALFAEYKFLLGVSLDGPEALHDKFRKDKGGAPTHAKVLKGISILKNHKVDFNILTLVSKANADNAAEVYRYLVENGFLHHQYIPCVEATPDGAPMPYSISGREWGSFMIGIFDEWVKSDVRKVSVRLFDCILLALVNDSPGICQFMDSCDSYFVMEHNGDVYPCDFFVAEENRLGNVNEDDWKSMKESSQYKSFARRKKLMNSNCGDCEWKWICQGDCPKHRIGAGVQSPESLSALCEGWKIFFSHSMDKFKELANEISLERKINSRKIIASGSAPTPGRNDLCVCGSGKKYKNCCL